MGSSFLDRIVKKTSKKVSKAIEKLEKDINNAVAQAQAQANAASRSYYYPPQPSPMNGHPSPGAYNYQANYGPPPSMNGPATVSHAASPPQGQDATTSTPRPGRGGPNQANTGAQMTAEEQYLNYLGQQQLTNMYVQLANNQARRMSDNITVLGTIGTGNTVRYDYTGSSGPYYAINDLGNIG